ncbi:MAG: LPS export ABC transporter ATP-binding protein [Alphaproteobacteria bacterium]
MSSANGLRVQSLSVKRGGRGIVEDISLSVTPGEIVGLIGPNGAGKSTAFHALVGLIPSTAKSLTLDGVDISRIAMFQRARRGLGYLPQEPTGFHGMTVKNNLTAVMEIAVKRSERADLLARLLSDFDLEKLADQRAETLSGGERRRLELARTMASRPKVVLLDEPFAGVDPIAIEGLQATIQKIRDLNVGILITDHNVRDMLKLVDRAVLIDRGSVLIEGTPAEITADESARNRYFGKSFHY